MSLPFERMRIFPTMAFSRIGIPIVQPPAGSIKPKPSKGHSTVPLPGLWR